MSAHISQHPYKQATCREDRSWAREILSRARATQLDLSHAWGMSPANTSRWLDGKLSGDLPISRAIAFCALTGIPLTEFIARSGLEVPGDAQVELDPVVDPPIGTLRVMPGKAPGRWHLLCHLDLSTVALRNLTELFDRVSADAIKRNSPV